MFCKQYHDVSVISTWYHVNVSKNIFALLSVAHVGNILCSS